MNRRYFCSLRRVNFNNPKEYTPEGIHRFSKKVQITWEEGKAIGQKGNYGLVLKEAGFEDARGHRMINIEKILINEMGQENIRLSYAEKNTQGLYKMVARPLEAIEDDIYELIKRGIENRVISPVLQAGLKTVIRSTKLHPLPLKPIKTAPYCDIYAQGEVLGCGHTIMIERIFIKGLNVFVIRFALYRQNENGFWAMALKPAHMSEEEFLYLFQDAIRKGVLSKVLVTAILTLL